MKRSNRINYLLEQLLEIDKELGGNAKAQNAKKKAEEFDDIRNNIMETLKTIEQCQAERDQKIKKYGVDKDNILTSIEQPHHLQIGAKIRDLILEVERDLAQLQRTLLGYIKKPKKYPRDVTENYSDQLSKLKEGLRQLKSKEYGVAVEQEEQRAIELKDLKGQPRENAINRYELTEAEQEALQRWNRRDQQMDEQLDQIIDGVDRIKDKAQNIGEKLEYTNAQVQELQKQVDKANKQIKNQNQQLKELLKTYRKPNKFCLDVTLVLVLLGLITVGANMAMKGNL